MNCAPAATSPEPAAGRADQELEDEIFETIRARAENVYRGIDPDFDDSKGRVRNYLPLITAANKAGAADGHIYEIAARTILKACDHVRVFQGRIRFPLTDSARNLVESNADEEALGKIELKNKEASDKTYKPDLVVELVGRNICYIFDLKRDERSLGESRAKPLLEKMKVAGAVAHDRLHQLGHRPRADRYLCRIVDCVGNVHEPDEILPIMMLDELFGIDLFSRIIPRVRELLVELQDALGDRMFIRKIVGRLPEDALVAAAQELIKRHDTPVPENGPETGHEPEATNGQGNPHQPKADSGDADSEPVCDASPDAAAASGSEPPSGAIWPTRHWTATPAP